MRQRHESMKLEKIRIPKKKFRYILLKYDKKKIWKRYRKMKGIKYKQDKIAKKELI